MIWSHVLDSSRHGRHGSAAIEEETSTFLEKSSPRASPQTRRCASAGELARTLIFLATALFLIALNSSVLFLTRSTSQHDDKLGYSTAWSKCYPECLSMYLRLTRNTQEPVREIVKWVNKHEPVAGHGEHYSPYAGPPTMDQYHNWTQLVQRKRRRKRKRSVCSPEAAAFMNLSSEEIAVDGGRPETVVRLADRPGHLGSLAIYHDLHCLVSRILSYGVICS